MTWLERAYEERDPLLLQAQAKPRLDLPLSYTDPPPTHDIPSPRGHLVRVTRKSKP